MPWLNRSWVTAMVSSFAQNCAAFSPGGSSIAGINGTCGRCIRGASPEDVPDLADRLLYQMPGHEQPASAANDEGNDSHDRLVMAGVGHPAEHAHVGPRAPPRDALSSGYTQRQLGRSRPPG